MNNAYIELIEDINELVEKRFGALQIVFPVIGYAALKTKGNRPNDKRDIFNSIDSNITNLDKFILRLDETLPHYEAHAEAAEIFPKVITFVNKELLPRYDRSDLILKYELPNWMENI